MLSEFHLQRYTISHSVDPDRKRILSDSIVLAQCCLDILPYTITTIIA